MSVNELAKLYEFQKHLGQLADFELTRVFGSQTQRLYTSPIATLWPQSYASPIVAMPAIAGYIPLLSLSETTDCFEQVALIHDGFGASGDYAIATDEKFDHIAIYQSHCFSVYSRSRQQLVTKKQHRLRTPQTLVMAHQGGLVLTIHASERVATHELRVWHYTRQANIHAKVFPIDRFAALSPDDQWVAFISRTGTALCVTRSTAQEIQQSFDLETDQPIIHLDFIDNQSVLVVCERSLRILDLATKKWKVHVVQQVSKSDSVAIDRRNNRIGILTTNYPNLPTTMLTTVDLSSGQSVSLALALTGQSLVLSDNLQTIWVREGYTAHLYNITTGTGHDRSDGVRGVIEHIEFSPHEDQLLVIERHQHLVLHLWNLSQEEEVCTLECHNNIYSPKAVFTRDGRYLILIGVVNIPASTVVQFWNLQTQSLEREVIIQFFTQIQHVTTVPDGQHLLIIAQTFRLGLWVFDIDNGDLQQLKTDIGDDFNIGSSIGVSLENNRVNVLDTTKNNDAGGVTVFDWTHRKYIERRLLPTVRSQSSHLSPRGEFAVLSTSKPTEVPKWSVYRISPKVRWQATLEGCTDHPIRQVLATHEFVFGVSWERLFIWKTKTGALIHTTDITRHHGFIRQVHASPSGKYLTINLSNGIILCWKCANISPKE